MILSISVLQQVKSEKREEEGGLDGGGDKYWKGRYVEEHM